MKGPSARSMSWTARAGIVFVLPDSAGGVLSSPDFAWGQERLATDWLTDIADTSLINPTPDDYRQAEAKFRGLSDQPITMFDAVAAVVATRLRLQVWTYDHHFDVMRVGVWRG